jgi:hypothetical protein
VVIAIVPFPRLNGRGFFGTLPSRVHIRASRKLRASSIGRSLFCGANTLGLLAQEAGKVCRQIGIAEDRRGPVGDGDHNQTDAELCCSAAPSARSTSWRMASDLQGIFFCERLQFSIARKIGPFNLSRTSAPKDGVELRSCIVCLSAVCV